MNLLIGCYTQKLSEEIVGQGEGIYCFDFNESTGEMQLLTIVPSTNPAYLALSPNNQYLYTVEEMSGENTPHVKAFGVSQSPPYLEFINQQEIPGSFACHLHVSPTGNHLLIANYGTGNVTVYPIHEDGSLGALSQTVQHKGHGPNKDRQEGPHVHMVCFNQGTIFVPDLGIDAVKAYQLDDESGQLVPEPGSDMKIAPGAGPRHLVFHPNNKHAMVFGELDSKIYLFRRNERFELTQSIHSLPRTYRNIPSGSAIRLHPNAKFLYVSNRGHDHIAVFSFDAQTEKLTLIGDVPTEGKTPREFNIHPSGKWLLAANQDSHTLSVFSIDTENGQLALKYQNEQVRSGSCIMWIT